MTPPRLAAGLLVGALLLGACGGDPEPAAAPPEPSTSPSGSPSPTTSPAAPSPSPTPDLPMAEPAALLDPVLPVRQEGLVEGASLPGGAAAGLGGSAPAESAAATVVAERLVARDSPDGAAVADLPAVAPLGGPRVLRVLETSDGWVRVLLPVRPNGASGWVAASDVSLSTVVDRLVVDVSDRTLTHLRGGAEVMTTPVVVGVAATPTPVGSFAVSDLVRPGRSGGPFGAAAFGLTGRSEVLEQFGGGDGQIAVHGTNRPELLGSAASNGCVRVGADALASLVGTLPLGTPVDVLP